jgi:hypothetical protein
MTIKTLNTSSETVIDELKSYSIEKALSQYIWNGFDENGRNVSVNFSIDNIGTVIDLNIKDDGDGISESNIEKSFGLFKDSLKKHRKSPTVKGKKGRGRLAFFRFSGIAEWNSIYDKNTLGIKIEDGALNSYSIEEPLFFSSGKGTVVRFSAIKPALNQNFIEQKLIPFIRKEYSCLLYTQYKSLAIPSFSFELSDHTSIKKTESINGNEFIFDSVVWENKQNEKSYIYFIDECGEIIHKELSKVNYKLEFHASCYVKSSWFNSFKVQRGQLEIEGECRNLDSLIFKRALKIAREDLKEHYRDFRSKLSDKLIELYETEGIFPTYNESNPILNQFRKDALVDVIKTLYEAEPDLFTKQLKLPQKKIFVRLLDRIISSDNVDDLFNIIEGVVTLEERDIRRLSNTLNHTTLSNITKAIHTVHQRTTITQAVDALMNKFTYETGEVAHLQGVVEDNLWLFGEQYQILTAEEPDFERALRELLKFHDRDDLYQKGMVAHEDSKKQMDIFAVRRIKQYDSATNQPYYKCLIVELKRPSDALKDKHLRQIEVYQSVIANSPYFNDGMHKWEMVLAGRRLSDSAAGMITSRLKSAEKTHGEHGLITDDGTFKVYIKSWNQLITEFNISHDFLLEKLELKKSSLGSDLSDTMEIIQKSTSNL